MILPLSHNPSSFDVMVALAFRIDTPLCTVLGGARLVSDGSYWALSKLYLYPSLTLDRSNCSEKETLSNASGRERVSGLYPPHSPPGSTT